MSRLPRLAFATAATVTLTLAVAPAASAEEPDEQRSPRTLTTEVISPFQIAVNKGTAYVADGGTSTVSKITENGLLEIAKGPQPGDVAGLDLSADGKSLAHTTTTYGEPAPGGGPPEIVGSSLVIKTEGRPDVVADLHKYEKDNNPDGHVWYGLGPDASECAVEYFAGMPGHGARYEESPTRTRMPWRASAEAHGRSPTPAATTSSRSTGPAGSRTSPSCPRSR